MQAGSLCNNLTKSGKGCHVYVRVGGKNCKCMTSHNNIIEILQSAIPLILKREPAVKISCFDPYCVHIENVCPQVSHELASYIFFKFSISVTTH